MLAMHHLTAFAVLFAACSQAAFLHAYADPSGDVRSLRTAYANRSADSHFDLSATLTYRENERGGLMIVEDETGAISIWNHSSVDSRTLHPGDRLRLSVRIGCGRQGNLFVNCTDLRVVAHGTPPAAIPITSDRLSNPVFENRLVRLEGVLTDVVPDDIDREWLYLVLDSGKGNVFFTYRTCGNETPCDHLIGATVSVSAFLQNDSPDRRRAIGVKLRIPSLDSIIVRKTGDGSSAAPVLSTAEIGFPLSLSRLRSIRRSAVGTVAAAWGGDRLLLRTDAGELFRGELARPGLPPFGSRIRLTGFPETDLYTTILVRSIWQPENGPAAPAETNVQALVVSMLQNESAGRECFDFSFHGRTIRLKGVVCELSVGYGDTRLCIRSDDRIVIADIGACPNAAKALGIGDLVEICGVCVMETDRIGLNLVFPRIKGFLIVPRTAADIVVLSRPSWWTPARLLSVIGALVLLLAAILVWNASLRMLALRRGRELFKSQIAKVSSELRVSERTRLAVELHDSITQNLTGVTLQLDAASSARKESPAEADALLGVARRSLQSCLDELRRCLWDLRSDALEERDFNQAIRIALRQVAARADVAVRFNVNRSQLSDATAHAILRIVRELVSNAIRHGRATKIRIAGERTSDMIRFAVSDNGCGFDTATTPGPADGHFGLSGVRERLKDIHGDIRLSSSPGKGTRAVISIKPTPAPAT